MRALTIDEEIKGKLALFTTELELNAADGMYSGHKSAENIIRELLNIVYDGAEFYNINVISSNVSGYDLRCDKLRCIVQITAENTKDKILSTIRLCDTEECKGYKLIIIIIASKKRRIRIGNMCCTYVAFNYGDDVWDMGRLSRILGSLPIKKKEAVQKFLARTIVSSSARDENESALECIIKLLSQEDNEEEEGIALSFKIEQKIACNDLNMRRSLIADVSGGLAVVERVYQLFEQEDLNKRKSVINAIRREYNLLADELKGVDLYDALVERIVSQVSYAAGLYGIKKEDVVRYCDMLIVDAFTNCKIFKKTI